ncbi:uncharacterized protein LOC143026953 [Oratosquilla oratoria]|uniref:uncharacterized protein LOC143026953 n=1 Tax=Oratosquilla oratoria TaxID=337810 RepID=UPI003F76B4FB
MRRLFQQFVVDNYVKVESLRLSFIEFNQSTMRKERADILAADSGKNGGQRVIIPPTFAGGPRYMKQRQQDALTYVTTYGSPDFFITFTMNPHWEELKDAVGATRVGDNAIYNQIQDRPDLVSMVFKMKIDALINELVKKRVFGGVKAHLYSIEWQKRGLPHAHILLWMEKCVTASLVDRIISAEIPDPEKEPRLHDIVTRNMIHGLYKGFNEQQPCCQGKNSKGDTCGKGFPKVCREELLFGNNGYPLYKRRSIGQGGNSIVKKVKGKDVTIENSWVVPYNAYLCLLFDAHINVECANTIKCIAYVTK